MGKKKGKGILSVVGFAVGFFAPAVFGFKAGAALAAGLYGASLGSTIWGLVARPKEPGIDMAGRFDSLTNTTSNDIAIPIIYGTRKWGGNIAYHKPSEDGKALVKDIVLCEGEIEGVDCVRVNDIPIKPYTAFKLKYTGNRQFATYGVQDNKFYLYAWSKNKPPFGWSIGVTDTITLEFNIKDKSIGELYNWINLQDGWQASEILPDILTKDLPKRKIKVGDTSGIDCKDAFKAVNTDSLPDCSYEFFNGAVHQPPPSNWETVGGYKNCAWIRVKLKASEKLNSSNPTITCTIKGKKVWVRKKGNWVYEYSENPAWCLRDLLLSRRYGTGRTVKEEMLDDESFEEVADYCDELITFKDRDGKEITEKRYTLNIVLDQKQEATKHLSDIFLNFCGFLTFTQDKISLRVEKPSPISYSFDDDTIVKDSVEITQIPLSETPNQYRITYFDAILNWKAIPIIVEDVIDIEERGGIVEKDVVFLGTTSQTQALRLARFYKDLGRVSSIVISFGVATHAMHLEPGDIVNVSWNEVFKEKPFRILEIREAGNSTYILKGREFNESIYNDTLASSIIVKDYTEIESPITDLVPDVDSVLLEPVYYLQKNGIAVSYIKGIAELPNYQFFRQILVDYSEDGGTTWYNGGGSQDENFIIPNAKVGLEYTVRVKIENSKGRISNGVLAKAEVTGKNNPPAKVAGLTCKNVSGGFLLTWQANAEPDIDGYNIYQGINLAEIEHCSLIAERVYSTSFFIPIEHGDNYIFYVVAVDTCDNAAEPVSISAVFDLPPDIEGFDVQKNGANIEFRWKAINRSGLRYEIRRGETWALGEHVAKTANNFYSTLFPIAGSHRFWIKGVDQYGNYSKAAAFSIIDLAPTNNRNQIMHINQVENGWQGVKINMFVNDSGLQLESNAIRGEHIIKVVLPKKLVARNWILSKLIGVSSVFSWENGDFNWKSPEAKTPCLSDGDATSATLKHQIAVFKGMPESTIEIFSLDGHLKGGKENTEPSESRKIIYEEGRFKQGVKIEDTTKLAWDVALPAIFNTCFHIKIDTAILDDVVYITLESSGGKLFIGYDAKNQVFYSEDDLGQRNEAGLKFKDNDFVTVGLSQGSQVRKVFLYSYSTKDGSTPETSLDT